MTSSQAKRIEHLKESFFRRAATDPNLYEFKMVSIDDREDGGLVFVALEVGRIGDETTLMSLYRTRGHFAIGIKGGVRVLSLTYGLSSEVKKKYQRQWVR